MVVGVDPGGSVAMVVAIEGPGPGPDLGRLPEVAAALGGELEVRPVAGGIEARFRLFAPGRARPVPGPVPGQVMDAS
jgi:hypothetical protein